MERENMISEELREGEQAQPDNNATPKDYAVFTSGADEGQFERVYEDTLYFVDGMVEQYDFYPEIIDALGNGSARIELKKRYMLKAINEEWIEKIEDCLPALDEVIRKPSRFIEETEKVLPIELSRNISSRSIQHLSQHTDYISKVEGDVVTPSKILNVFRDETNKTYENKFINTLINRLFWFVEHRYETALKEGKDEKNTSLDYTQDFTHGQIQGKIHFRIEMAEEPQEGEVLKNYTYTTDLWQRVIRLHHICRTYINSEFVKSMDNQFIRPPVIRTNAILKNKNLRQCLELWEFIEGYENIGYDMLVQENLEDIDQRYIKEIYSVSALQYLIFRYNVKNEFESNKTLASAMTPTVLTPQVEDTLSPLDASEFKKNFLSGSYTEEEDLDAKRRPSLKDRAVLRAVNVALISDAIIKRNDLVSKFPKRRLPHPWVKKLKNGGKRLQTAAKRVGTEIRNGAVYAVDTTVNSVKSTANDVALGAKCVADGAKKGWETSTQRVEDYCRSHSKEIKRIADVSTDLAIKAAVVGVAVIRKTKEKNK